MKSFFLFLKKVARVNEFRSNYISRNLSIVLVASIVATAMITIVGLITNYLDPKVHYITGFSALFLLFINTLNKKGYHTLAGILTVLTMFIVANLSMIVGKGFRDEVILVFPGIIVLSSLILSRFYFVFFSVISILNVVFFGFAEIQGIIVHDVSSYINYGQIFSAYIILTATAFLIDVLNRDLVELSKKNLEHGNYFKSFFNSSPEGTIILDLNGTIQHVNKNIVRLFDSSRKKIIGIALNELINESDSNRLSKFIEGFKKGITYNNPIEVSVEIKNKGLIKISIRLILIRDDNNKPNALGAFIKEK